MIVAIIMQFGRHWALACPWLILGRTSRTTASLTTLNNIKSSLEVLTDKIWLPSRALKELSDRIKLLWSTMSWVTHTLESLWSFCPILRSCFVSPVVSWTSFAPYPFNIILNHEVRFSTYSYSYHVLSSSSWFTPCCFPNLCLLSDIVLNSSVQLLPAQAFIMGHKSTQNINCLQRRQENDTQALSH